LHIVCSTSNLLNSTPLKTLCKLIDYPMKAPHNYQAAQNNKLIQKTLQNENPNAYNINFSNPFLTFLTY